MNTTLAIIFFVVFGLGLQLSSMKTGEHIANGDRRTHTTLVLSLVFAFCLALVFATVMKYADLP